MKLKDIMIADVQQVSPDATMSQTAAIMLRQAVGCVVVTRNGAIKGILTDRDLLHCMNQHHDPYQCAAAVHMTHPVIVLPPDEDHLSAVDVMQNKRIKRLPIAQGGKLVGIVSMSDLTLIAEGASWTLIAGLMRTQAVQIWQPKTKAVGSEPT